MKGQLTRFQLVVVIFNCLIITNLASGSADEEPQDPMHVYRRPPSVLTRAQAEDSDFWMTSAQSLLAENIKQKNIEGVAKNAIFFLGDGMSLATTTAARILKGEMEKFAYGEDGVLSFEKFPNVGLSKTYCADSQVADSACSATAYLCGTKANIGTIGVKPGVILGDCAGQLDKSQHVSSLMSWAQAAGKSTGLVTTTRITHATPAGTFAHVAHRDWENDAVVTSHGQDPNKCDDIAEQLILQEPGRNINVIFGGGRREMVDKSISDPETGAKGRRRDGKDLIDIWKTIKSSEGDRAQYVWNKTQFDELDSTKIDHVLGLFNYDHLDYVMDKQDDPSLTEMVQKAIAILNRNPKGFFLFVEGGRIDHAHHDGMAKKSLRETIELSNAVDAAVKLTDVADTLILVTADHAHTMTISGYPERGNPIMGVAGLADDNLPYTTLGYANGLGYRKESANGRYNLTRDDLNDPNYRQQAMVPLLSETHGGDDVIIYARGPFSHLFRGVVQQSYIPHVVAYASNFGPGLKFQVQEATTDGASPIGGSLLMVMAVAIFLLFEQQFLF